MIGWIVTLLGGTFVAVVATILAPAFGGVWGALPWFGWWYLFLRLLAPPSMRVGGYAPAVILLLATAATVPWTTLLVTLGMGGAAEGAERFLFTQRRHASYGAAAAASLVACGVQTSVLGVVMVVVVSIALTRVALRLKAWWWL